mmetsp:Transcript_9023/g.10483  ORF Transcript_9023/g.10483 Transcript_9023/m.10483 type:complete len:86 (+) Transcript_9023:57-314(+)
MSRITWRATDIDTKTIDENGDVIDAEELVALEIDDEFEVIAGDGIGSPLVLVSIKGFCTIDGFEDGICDVLAIRSGGDEGAFFEV